MTQIPVEAVVFDRSIYPRENLVEEQVKRYAEAVEAGAIFPPILLDQKQRLLDGAHRLEAYKRTGVKVAAVEMRECANDAEAYRVACELNTSHGIQMNRSERYRAALRLYEDGTDPREIGRVLGTTERTIYNWTDKLREAAEVERNALIERMLKDGATQKEIATALGVDQTTVSRIMQNCNFAKTHIVTVGYEGHTLESFLAALKAAKVTNLWDVRDSNTSQMKPEFSGASLERAMRAAGIAYEHKRRLGIPHLLRSFLLSGPLELGEAQLEEAYGWYVTAYGETVNLDDLRAQIAGNGRTALMCLEASGKPCHRHYLVKLIGLKSEDISLLGREAVSA